MLNSLCPSVGLSVRGVSMMGVSKVALVWRLGKVKCVRAGSVRNCLKVTERWNVLELKVGKVKWAGNRTFSPTYFGQTVAHLSCYWALVSVLSCPVLCFFLDPTPSSNCAADLHALLLKWCASAQGVRTMSDIIWGECATKTHQKGRQ